MSVAAQPMARKSAKDPRESWERKPLILQMRGSPEWKAWLEEGAAFSRTTIANLIDQAVTKHLRDMGFPKPPPER